MRIIARTAAIGLLLGPLTAVPAAKPAALFSSYDLLTLELKAPFGQLFESARDDDSVAVPATLSYQNRDGREVVLPDVKLSLRDRMPAEQAEALLAEIETAAVGVESPPTT